MVLSSYQESEQNDELKKIIIFFAGTVAHLQEVKLDKLIYLAHLYHYIKYGKNLTSTRFLNLTFGPHAPALRSAIKKLSGNKYIYFKASRTSSDPIYSNPCLIIKSAELNYKKLCYYHVDTLQEVLGDWGDKPYEPILDYTARTIPCLCTPYREAIDWTLARPQIALRDVLSYPRRLWIHRFVERPETPMPRSDAWSRIGVISVNEVAEIYLALCGVQPEKTPPRGYLGFDLRSVYCSLDLQSSGNQDGWTMYPGKIDQAAMISGSLMNTLSFRGHSSRVAIMTGILFLKKSGYVLNGDLPEEHWPDDNSYDSLKAWFEKVCIRADTTKTGL